MTPKREKQLRENIFEMWYDLLGRACAIQCDPDLGGTEQQLESEYKILEVSKAVLKKNFIENYHLDESIIQRDDENQRLLKEL